MMSSEKFAAEPLGDRAPDGAPRGKDRIGIDIRADLARYICLARQAERERREGGVERRIADELAECGDEALVRWSLRIADDPQHHRGGIGLRRLPAIERVGIAPEEAQEILVTEV